MSQRQWSHDNPAGQPIGGMTATQPPPSRDNPAAEGCHVTIPPPRDTTRVLANAKERPKLATRQERLSGGLRAPATGGTTLQARMSDSRKAPATGGVFQHGPQGPGGPPRGERRGTPWAPRIKAKHCLHLQTTLKRPIGCQCNRVKTTSKMTTCVHRCVCVRASLRESKSGKTHRLCVSNGEGD